MNDDQAKFSLKIPIHRLQVRRTNQERHRKNADGDEKIAASKQAASGVRNTHFEDVLREKLALKDEEIRKLHGRIKTFVLLERKMDVQKKSMCLERRNHERNMSQYRSRLMDAERSIEILSRSVSAPTLAAAGARRGSTTITSFDEETSMQRRLSISVANPENRGEGDSSKRRNSVGGLVPEQSGGTPREGNALKRKSSLVVETPGYLSQRRGSVIMAERSEPITYSNSNQWDNDPYSDLVRRGKVLLPSRPRSAYTGRELRRDQVTRTTESIVGKFARYQSAGRFRAASEAKQSAAGILQLMQS